MKLNKEWGEGENLASRRYLTTRAPMQPNPPIRSRYIVRISRPERIPLVSAPPHDGSATFSTWSAPAVSAEVFAALLEAPAGAPAK